MLLEVGYVLGFVLAGALGAGVEALAFVLMRVGSWSVNGRDSTTLSPNFVKLDFGGQRGLRWGRIGV